MTSYSTEFFNRPLTENVSKKHLSEMVQLRIANSLSDLNLSGKKFENKLKKISKMLAKDIVKANRKQKKSDTGEDSQN